MALSGATNRLRRGGLVGVAHLRQERECCYIAVAFKMPPKQFELTNYKSNGLSRAPVCFFLCAQLVNMPFLLIDLGQRYTDYRHVLVLEIVHREISCPARSLGAE